MMPLADFGALERIDLEPLFEQVRGRLRDEFRDPVEFFLAQARGVLTELEQAHHDRAADSDDGSGGTRLMIGLIAFAARAMTRHIRRRLPHPCGE